MTHATAPTYDNIRAELIEDGSVLRLVLDRPKANILSMAMVRDLAAALEAHRDRPELKLVFLRGAEGRFSYGASIEEHRKDVAPDMLRGFHRFIRQLATYPIPTAALVEGPCLGGGFEVVLCCHFIFAVDGASLACPEIKLGVIPPVLAALGRLRLGGPTAERMLLTGGAITPEEARRLGLVSEVFAAGADAEAKLLEWYRGSLAPLSGLALRQGALAARGGAEWRAALEKDLELAEERYLAKILTSHDGNEGIEAFLEKRPPRWVNA